MSRRRILFAFLTVFCRVVVGLVQPRTGPTVTLDSATVTGTSRRSTNRFLGIPYAQPPTGNLRFQLPQSLPSYDASFSATKYGPACPQQVPIDVPAYLIGIVTAVDELLLSAREDCLTLDVITPVDATPESNFPVIVWTYGGGFEMGSTRTWDGSVIVERSVKLGVPAVYVSMNYRLNAFGFLASQEVKDAGVGNLGLRDQRLALQWIQKYIRAFGGDPTKVTLWGQSSGAMSVALHMLTNGADPEGLFRAAFMQSGSPGPIGDITQGQGYYDALVTETGCSGVADTLQCLREVRYETLLEAVNKSPGIFSYQSLAIAWRPRVDGDFVAAEPERSVQQGLIADIPFISGNCDDEGTLFALSSLNISTDAEFEQYLGTYFVPNGSATALEGIMEHYPSDRTQGSPFDTGKGNAITPQFKRVAAFLGDAIFQAPRRFFVQSRSGKQNIWTYLSKRQKSVPILGSRHGSDDVFSDSDLAAYLVRFAAHLDPNVGESTDLYWPPYDATNQIMLELLDGAVTQALTTDTYRTHQIAYLTNVTLGMSS